MNKTKRVAWHKHLKRARHEKDKARVLARGSAPDRASAARGASGVHSRPTATTRPTSSRASGTSSRQTTPRQ